MTITITAETEARLSEKAAREGINVDAVAEALILTALEWEAQERSETIAAVHRADQAAIEGRERPLAAFLAEQRSKYGLSPTWSRSDSH